MPEMLGIVANDNLITQSLFFVFSVDIIAGIVNTTAKEKFIANSLFRILGLLESERYQF